MYDTKLTQPMLATIRRALEEDLGPGDVTGRAIIPADQWGRGRIIARADGVLAGMAVAAAVFACVDGRVSVQPEVDDGQPVTNGKVVARLTGPVRAILGGERVALNYLQRMSGIATATRRLVDQVKGTEAIILDTRKTAPGLRLFDKKAVRLGGGRNHRFGLYDMALIKENHVAAAGGLAEAVARVRAAGAGVPIEVEVTDLDQLQEALALDLDRIMLDNMSVDDMRRAVVLTAGRVPLEASGNVTLLTVRSIAETGVNFISSGALTHSVTALDLSLLLDEEVKT